MQKTATITKFSIFIYKRKDKILACHLQFQLLQYTATISIQHISNNPAPLCPGINFIHTSTKKILFFVTEFLLASSAMSQQSATQSPHSSAPRPLINHYLRQPCIINNQNLKTIRHHQDRQEQEAAFFKTTLFTVFSSTTMISGSYQQDSTSSFNFLLLFSRKMSSSTNQRAVSIHKKQKKKKCKNARGKKKECNIIKL